MRTDRWIERGGRWLLKLAPPAFRAAWQDDILDTLGRRMADARRQHGRLRAIATGFLELANLTRAVIQARVGAAPWPHHQPIDTDTHALKPRRIAALADDARHAYRRFRSKIGTSVAAVAMLGLGIGIMTAMFTVVDALLLRPAPFRDADRLAHVSMMDEHGGRTDVAPAVLRAWRTSPVFEAAEGTSTGTTVIDAAGVPVVSAAGLVTPGLFDMLGIRPIRGRTFDPAQDARDVALISEDLWRDVFNADPGIIGRRIQLDDAPATIVGIMPAAFRFPEWNTEVWRPIDDHARARAVVRFASGVPQVDALKTAGVAAHAADASTAALYAVQGPVLGATNDTYYQRAVSLLAGGVALVFLILCANVAGLLFARFTARSREFSMCAALGASRGRLFRQAFLESALLAVLGALAGIGLAWELVAVAHRFLPEAFLTHTLSPLALDRRALGVAIASTLLSTLAAGLLPAWFGTRPDRTASLRAGERGSTETRRVRVVTRTLLVAEVALACTLLVGATLLMRSFVNLAHLDLGFNPRGLVTVEVSFNRKLTQDAASRQAAAGRVADALKNLPGVGQVAWSNGAPPMGSAAIYFYHWLTDTPGSSPTYIVIRRYRVGADIFSMYGIHMLKGRTFQPEDDASAVIVGERLAAALWPGGDPIGHSFGAESMHYHVIGVAKEVRRPIIDPELSLPDMYEALLPGGGYSTASLRCDRTCPSEGVIRARLLSEPTVQSVYRVTRLEDAYQQDLAQPRATAALGFAFAGIALIAVAAGLFSVLSYAVGRRRREFGIRAALGASPHAIQGLVLRDGLTVALVGVAVGSTAAWLLAKTLASLEYGVSASDPISWLLVLSVLAVTTLGASWRPARDAMRVDPVSLLRED